MFGKWTAEGETCVFLKFSEEFYSEMASEGASNVGQEIIKKTWRFSSVYFYMFWLIRILNNRPLIFNVNS